MLSEIDRDSTVCGLRDEVWSECGLTLGFFAADGLKPIAPQTRLSKVVGDAFPFPPVLPELRDSMTVADAEACFRVAWGVHVEILRPRSSRRAKDNASIRSVGFMDRMSRRKLPRLDGSATVKDLRDAIHSDLGLRVDVVGIGANAKLANLLETVPPPPVDLSPTNTAEEAEAGMRTAWGIDVRILAAEGGRAANRSQVLSRLGLVTRQEPPADDPAPAAEGDPASSPVVVEAVRPRIRRVDGCVEGLDRIIAACPYPVAMALHRAGLSEGRDRTKSMEAFHCVARVLTLPLLAMATGDERARVLAREIIAKPSIGHWTRALFLLAAEEASHHPWAGRLLEDLDRPLTDPAAIELAVCFGRYKSKPFSRQRISARELFDGFTQYRNTTDGHGRPPGSSEAEEHGRLLFRGACMLADRCAALSSLRIVEILDHRETVDGPVSDACEWVGLRPVRVEVDEPPPGSDPSRLHRNLLLFAPEAGSWHRLDGWVYHGERASGKDLLVFNGEAGSGPTYLTFHNGLGLYGHHSGRGFEDGQVFELRPELQRERYCGLMRLKIRLGVQVDVRQSPGDRPGP